MLPLLWQFQAKAGVGIFNLCVQHLEALEAGRRLGNYAIIVAFRQTHQEAQMLNWPIAEGVVQFYSPGILRRNPVVIEKPDSLRNISYLCRSFHN